MFHLFKREDKKREQQEELLSAYLDDQLSAEEREDLEAQLADDPAMRIELDALRQTVAMVRDLPVASVPRNLILPQKTEARPQIAPAAPPHSGLPASLMAAATAIAGLLFVIVLARDLLFFTPSFSSFAPAVEAPQEMAISSPDSPELEAGEESIGTPAMSPETAPSSEESAPEERAATIPTTDEQEPANDALTTPGYPTASAPAFAAEEGKEGGAVLTPSPTSRDVGEAAPPPSAQVETEAAKPGVPEEGANASLAWRVLEIGLGLLYLGLALATVWVWRTRR